LFIRNTKNVYTIQVIFSSFGCAQRFYYRAYKSACERIPGWVKTPQYQAKARHND
jgi:hypothetical protein